MDFYTMESAVEINKFHTEPTTKQTQKQLVVFFIIIIIILICCARDEQRNQQLLQKKPKWTTKTNIQGTSTVHLQDWPVSAARVSLHVFTTQHNERTKGLTAEQVT